MKKNMVELKCSWCEKTFLRNKYEYKYSQKLGRKSFCSLSCSVSYGNKLYPRKGSTEHLRGRQCDEYSPFRWFMKVIRARCKRHRLISRSLNSTDITLEYLKELWEQQTGKCSLTGWKLILPEYSDGWKSEPRTDRASLDRIDNAKGYIQGNVRYIAWMANICRATFSDNDVKKFANAVVLHSETILGRRMACCP